VAEPVLALNLLKFLPVAVVCALLFIGCDKAGTVRTITLRRSAGNNTAPATIRKPAYGLTPHQKMRSTRASWRNWFASRR